MESRIMRVFYGNDCLPYKNSARTVHYPIVGNSFVGASNIVQIRFYVRDIGGVDDISWVAMSKLPNGKLGSQILNEIVYDERLDEYYIALDLSSYYTQYKGDVYIALNGYQGDFTLEQDEETGIYRVVDGTPYIMVTGSIKVAINYAPQLQPGADIDINNMQLILGLISDKASIRTTIQVVDNISQADLSGYNAGQLFYDLYSKQYYEKTLIAPYYDFAENGSGILGSKRTIVRYNIDFTTVTINNLLTLAQGRVVIANDGTDDYLVRFETSTNTVRFTDLSTLETWCANSSQLSFSTPISNLITSTYLDVLATQEWTQELLPITDSEEPGSAINRQVWLDPTDDLETTLLNAIRPINGFNIPTIETNSGTFRLPSEERTNEIFTIPEEN